MLTLKTGSWVHCSLVKLSKLKTCNAAASIVPRRIAAACAPSMGTTHMHPHGSLFLGVSKVCSTHSSKKHREKGLLLLLLKVARQGGLITEQTLPHTICWVYCRTTFVIIQLAGVTLCKSTISAFTRRVIRLYVAILPNRTLGCIAPAIGHFVVVLQMTWSIAIVGGIRTTEPMLPESAKRHA